MLAKLPDLQLAAEGILTPEQAAKLKVIQHHYDDLDKRKSELEQIILSLSVLFSDEINLTITAPSIGNIFTAIAVVSEIGVDMNAFTSSKHLCSWAGLTPSNNESAGKKKSAKISRAGCYLKPLLVQWATAVVVSEKHPEIRDRYLRIKKRRGHKCAIIANARMLLTAIYQILKKCEPYNPELYKKTNIPPVDREITAEQALIIARNLR